MSRRGRGRAPGGAALVAAVLIAGVVAGASPAGAASVEVCRSEPVLAPEIDVAVVHLPSAEVAPEDLSEAVTALPEVSVAGRYVVPGSGPEAPADWTRATDATSLAATLDSVGAARPGGLVVLAAGSDEEVAALGDATGAAVAVADRPVGEEALDRGEAVAGSAQDAQARLVARNGANVDPAAGALVTRVGEAWAIDLSGRLAEAEATVSSVAVTTQTGEVLTADCGAGATLPLLVGGEELDGASVAVSASVADGPSGQPLAVTAQGILAPDADPHRRAGDVEVEVATPDTKADGAAGDDGSASVATSGGEGTEDADESGGGGGGGVGLLVVGGLGLLALLGVVAAAVLLARRPSGAAPPAVPAAAGPPPGAPPPPPPPPPDVEAPPPPPPAPPPASDPDPEWAAADPGEAPVAIPSACAPVAGGLGEGGSHRWWVLPHRTGLYLGGWAEKVAGHGEDAAPLLQVHESGAAAVAVFDGTGGAGAAIARRDEDGAERTGAWLGSRLAREVTSDWAVARWVHDDTPDLEDRLRSWFHQQHAAGEETSTVRGSLRRALPTTLAAVTVRPVGDKAAVEVLWAGDSRCYSLRPDRGLQVLTRDDTREGDALALIRDDQPMLNLVCADRPFTLHHLTRTVTPPAVFVVATDGCFGYVATPAHFEMILLDSLEGATDAEDWARRLVRRIDAVAGDDSSWAIACPGIRDLDVLRRALAERTEALRAEHWTPFTETDDPAVRDDLRERSWATYRATYEAVLPEAAP